jgi:hypothetical protein
MDINLPAAANRASVSYYILPTILATLHMWQQRYGVPLSLKTLPFPVGLPYVILVAPKDSVNLLEARYVPLLQLGMEGGGGGGHR